MFQLHIQKKANSSNHKRATTNLNEETQSINPKKTKKKAEIMLTKPTPEFRYSASTDDIRRVTQQQENAARRIRTQPFHEIPAVLHHPSPNPPNIHPNPSNSTSKPKKKKTQNSNLFH